LEKKFNIRVYGLLIENNSVLVTDEIRMGMIMTKFPGGGLQWGEGIEACLKREFKEELNIEINIVQHFYTTDYFQQSAFNKNDQLISIYYIVKASVSGNFIDTKKRLNINKTETDQQVFRWIDLNKISAEDFTFPVDKKVGEMLKIKRISAF
jgi:8-oxo-dGTP diphosphatase